MSARRQIDVKYLIVNGDDLGASPGINRGILKAHHSGILTSASLMVNQAAAKEAAEMSRAAPRLSVGLHADLAPQTAKTVTNPTAEGRCRDALSRQWARFLEMMGRAPTHLDSHHNAHRDPRLLPVFLDFARRNGVPLRENSSVRYFSKFYGQWSGKTHLEQISVANLARMLSTEIQDRFTELSCHPGYVEADFPSAYSHERHVEVQTLCAPSLRPILVQQGIQLISYHELPNLLKDTPSALAPANV
jgi:chitin disaccharide deacetylase